jgi:hypothetical protein
MKVIFLDIDGVLATQKEFEIPRGEFWELHPDAKDLGIPYPWNKDCVDVLNEILDETNAVIVLSSDWKHHFNLKHMDAIFKWNGVKKSPIMFTDNDSISFGNLTMNRAWEIEKCIRSQIKAERWVILDDLWLHKYLKNTNDDDKFFLTKDDIGLAESGLKEKIIKKLNR